MKEDTHHDGHTFRRKKYPPNVYEYEIFRENYVYKNNNNNNNNKNCKMRFIGDKNKMYYTEFDKAVNNALLEQETKQETKQEKEKGTKTELEINTWKLQLLQKYCIRHYSRFNEGNTNEHNIMGITHVFHLPIVGYILYNHNLCNYKIYEIHEIIHEIHDMDNGVKNNKNKNKNKNIKDMVDYIGKDKWRENRVKRCENISSSSNSSSSSLFCEFEIFVPRRILVNDHWKECKYIVKSRKRKRGHLDDGVNRDKSWKRCMLRDEIQDEI